MTKARLLKEIDSREITEQMAYNILINKRRQNAGKPKELTLQEKFKNIMGAKIKKKSKKVKR